MPKQCFYLPVEVKDTELVRQGVLWLFKNSKYSGGWLAVNFIKNIKNISAYSGLAKFGKLINPPHCAEINGALIHLITEQMIPENGKRRPLLAIHPSRKLLYKLDNISNITQMTVAPFIGKELEYWVKLHNAIQLPENDNNTSDEDASIQLTNHNGVVIAALEDLNRKVDLTQNLWENKVKFESIALFSILNDNGVNYDPRTVKEYLKSNLGWNPLAADQASKVAEQIRSGNRYKQYREDVDKYVSYWADEFSKK